VVNKLYISDYSKWPVCLRFAHLLLQQLYVRIFLKIQARSWWAAV